MFSPQNLDSLFESPANGGAAAHRDASDDELEILVALNEHFGHKNYKLPISEDVEAEMTVLTEREMMFLVSTMFRVIVSVLLMRTVSGDFHAVCAHSVVVLYDSDADVAIPKVSALD